MMLGSGAASPRLWPNTPGQLCGPAAIVEVVLKVWIVLTDGIFIAICFILLLVLSAQSRKESSEKLTLTIDLFQVFYSSEPSDIHRRPPRKFQVILISQGRLCRRPIKLFYQG
jgi:hypothetical protein